MHGYFLQLDNAKMAKSSGEFLTLDVVEEKGFSSLAYRYFCFSAHYRTQMSFSWASLDAAQRTLNRLYETAWNWGEPGEVSADYVARLDACLNDDLNMPRALAVLWELVRSEEADSVKKATLLACDDVLGLDIANWAPAEIEVPDEVSALVQAREEARAAKDWGRADELRKQVSDLGYVIEDTKEGAKIARA